MNPGDPIQIKATVLRVDGDRVDTQTPDGQLIQTDLKNVVESKKERPIMVAGGATEHDVKEASKGKNAGGGKAG